MGLCTVLTAHARTPTGCSHSEQAPSSLSNDRPSPPMALRAKLYRRATVARPPCLICPSPHVYPLRSTTQRYPSSEAPHLFYAHHLFRYCKFDLNCACLSTPRHDPLSPCIYRVILAYTPPADSCLLLNIIIHFAGASVVYLLYVFQNETSEGSRA